MSGSPKADAAAAKGSPKAGSPKAEEKGSPKAASPKAGSPKKAAGGKKPAPKGRGKGQGGKGGKGQGGRGQARLGGPGRVSGGKAQLVEEVKANQRADPGWRRAWANYCQQHGSDVRDPSKHAQSWLQRAISTLGGAGAGGRGGPQSYGGGYSERRASPHCIDQVKANQRADAGWHQAWTNYCMVHGQGISDPARHSDRWIVKACRTLGPPQVPYQYMDAMGMIQTVYVPLQQNHVPHIQQQQGPPRSRQGYAGGNRSRGGGGWQGGGGGQQRSRGGMRQGGLPRSRGGFGGAPQRGGLSSRGGAPGGGYGRGGLRSRGGYSGGGGGGGAAPRSRGGGGGGAAAGRPRSRGGYRPPF